jgi:hypothetical protein
MQMNGSRHMSPRADWAEEIAVDHQAEADH